MLSFLALTAPVDYQFSDITLTFTNGTTELQQCFNITLVVDNRLESLEFLQLIATPNSGSSVSQFILIESEDCEFQIVCV